MSRILSPLALVLAATPAAAQDEIVVTGQGLTDERERTAPVVTLDRERLTASASGRLEDVLGDVAGIQSFRRADSRSANPTSQGLTLRGIGGNASSRALLILDGVPQADPFGGWIAFPAYAPSRLGQVRVTRGGGGTIWGSGALSGLIALESATPNQLSPFSADVFYGERNAVDGQASASLVRDTGFATLSAGYARGDGFVPIVEEDRGAIDRPAPYEQASVAARVVTRIAADTELQANVQALVDRRDRGTPFSEIESDAADASVRLVGRGRWRWSALAYVQSRRFASRFTSIADDRSAATPALDQYNVPGFGHGARVEVAPPLGEAIGLTLGADWRATGGTTQERFSFSNGGFTRLRKAGGATETLGAFADASWRVGPFRVEAAGRVDRWRIVDGRLVERTIPDAAVLTDTRFADRSGHEWTGRLGLGWQLAAPLRLRASAYRNWRLPTPNELYRPFRAGPDATAANAALRPETLEGVDLGADLQLTDDFTVGATLFANRLNDAIANVTLARGPGTFPGVGFVSAAGIYRRRDNLEAIESRGVEVDARYTAGPWRLAASYAYADARVRDDAPGDLRPAQVPAHQASATIGWSRDRLRALATLRYVSAQFEDDQNERPLADALTLDAVLGVPLTPALALEARAENLTDARVETGYSGDALERARPRTLWIGVRATID